MISHAYRRSVVGSLLMVVVLIAPCAAVRAQANPEHVRSEVSIDRSDKQNISGKTEIAFAWGEHFDPPQNLIHGVINLKEAMNRWTNVATTLNEHLLLSDPDIKNLPFVFVSTNKVFELTETEKRNLRAYFENGGFMFLDNCQAASDFSASGASLRKMLEDVVSDARFAPVPDSHHLYHCFFDFNDGPPQGTELGNVPLIPRSNTEIDLPRPETITLPPARYSLEGVWLDGDLVAVYSDKGYVVKWNDTSNNEPQLRMGVNLIVYALTRGRTNAIRNFP